MSAAELRLSTPPSSPGSSASLMDTMEDTRLVLSAFLRQSLDTAPSHRPGRVGGAYRDTNKFSVAMTESQRWAGDEWDSLAEQITAAEEKKHGFKHLIKKRLRRRLVSQGPRTDHPAAERKADPVQNSARSSLCRLEVSETSSSPGFSQFRTEKPALEQVSASSSSDEGQEKKEKKKKTKFQAFSSFLSKLKPSRKEGIDDELPNRPDALPFTEEPENQPLSSFYPPQFYEEVAGTLDRIAQKCTAAIPEERHTLLLDQSANATENKNKEDVVKQLVQILSTQGDAIDRKIQLNPSLRSTLARLSYPSFSKLLDMFACQGEVLAMPCAGSTLSHVAMTMEVSRRVITATGTQRMWGYAEQYMQNFAPWVHSQGGWEKIVQSEELSEYD